MSSATIECQRGLCEVFMDVIIGYVIRYSMDFGAIIIALTIHEFCHGLMAYSLGDHTAKIQGRLTLNPLAHLDLLGFLMLMIAKFGWAKPVPVNPSKFTRADVRTGMVLVGAAGPLSNLFLGFVFLTIFIFLRPRANLNYFLSALILVNMYLAFFNLLPIPPLDGSRILFGILPGRFYRYMAPLERYGSVILLILILTGSVARIIGPLARGMIQAFMDLSLFIFGGLL